MTTVRRAIVAVLLAWNSVCGIYIIYIFEKEVDIIIVIF